MKKLNKRQKLIILIAIITVIVIIGIAIGANAIRTNIANSSYESSNSGSNNGNLLPEYIKKGITLGGVTGTLEDLDTSDATATAMDIAYGEVAYARGERIVGMYVNRGDVQVGDYVAYTPDTAESYSLPTTVSGYTSDQSITQNTSLTWQVLSINDDGTIDLISNRPTTQFIYFRGAIGYNNAVYVLNDICAQQYSNQELGVTARSINLEDDIEPKMNEAGIAARDSYGSGQTYAYGNVRTYTSSSRYYPNLYAQEKGSGIDTGVAREDGIAKNDSYYSSPTEETYTQAGTSLTVTSDYYIFSSSNSPSYFDDTTWYDLVFNTSSYYWLASRCVRADSTYAIFYLRLVGNGVLSFRYLFYSYNYEYSNGYYLRPVVSLGSGVQIYGGDGSAEHPYQLSA